MIGTLSVGGAELQLTMLAEALASRGWSVDVFVLEPTGDLISRVRAFGINVIDGGCRLSRGGKFSRAVSLIRCQLRLLSFLVRTKPTVVHAFLPLTNLMGAIAGRIALAPCVVTSKRGLGTHQDRVRWFRHLDRIANRLSHVVTANSIAVAEDTARRDGFALAKIRVIPNGLDMSRFQLDEMKRGKFREQLGLNESDIAIVKVANLIPYKGHLELIEAFGMLAGEDRRIKLFLIGEDRGILEDLVRAARPIGIEDRIAFMGLRDDIEELLSAMDVGVMASHEEGSSNALLEKLAAGLPVVATNVGGNSESLSGMPNCELVQPKNPVDLARGLRTVINGLEAARETRSDRRKLVNQRFSVQMMVEAHESLYVSILLGGKYGHS